MIVIAQSTLKILHNFWFFIAPYQIACFVGIDWPFYMVI